LICENAMKTLKEVLISLISVFGISLILLNCSKKSDEPSITVVDKDGNVYKTTTIGTQIWMAENLKTTKYLNGELIGTTDPASQNITGESEPKYQWAYLGDESKVADYGRLYSWYTVTDSRGICPAGWHVPTETELMNLTAFLGGDTIDGKKLKEKGTAHWNSPNTGATNETGFTALPGGYHGYGGSFEFMGYAGYWWSATEADANNAWYRGLYYNGAYEHNLSNSKKVGFSVRCLKN
jgi:uncharacterized protein (TIGR02145 family)